MGIRSAATCSEIKKHAAKNGNALIKLKLGWVFDAGTVNKRAWKAHLETP